MKSNNLWELKRKIRIPKHFYEEPFIRIFNFRKGMVFFKSKYDWCEVQIRRTISEKYSENQDGTILYSLSSYPNLSCQKLLDKKFKTNKKYYFKKYIFPKEYFQDESFAENNSMFLDKINKVDQ